MQEYMWVEKHRPKTIKDVVLPDHLKEQFFGMVENNTIPNMVLSGSHGIGKTTIAKALCDELGATVLFLNGSLDGVKDTLRNDIKDFSTSMSMDGSRKVVIIDEADGMSSQMQPSLRTFMEQYSKNVSFILTCNHPYRIIPEIRESRCSHIEFKFTKDDKKAMAKNIFLALCDILDKEGVKHDRKVVAQLVKKKFPDMRKMIVELQRYSMKGSIDEGLLVSFDDISVKQLIATVKAKNFDGIRNWVISSDYDQHDVYSYLFEHSKDLMADKDSEANLILTLADYQDKATRAVNPDINLTAALIEIAVNVTWKE